MGEYIPYLLLLVLGVATVITLFARIGVSGTRGTMIIVMLLVAFITVLRVFDIVSYPNLWVWYGGLVSVNYLLTFVRATLFYHDPAQNDKSIPSGFTVLYVVPVFNEQVFIARCADSILRAARFAQKAAGVTTIIRIADDASEDETLSVLRKRYENVSNVEVIGLRHNAGKKGAIAHAICGGPQWREGYSLFRERYGHDPTRNDMETLKGCLREVGCNPVDADYILMTDSDSVVSVRFIYYAIKAFLYDPMIGAVSGLCDVWLEPGKQPTLITLIQVAWYHTQFSIRKAAEGFWVFCVSGPGSAFRTEAVLPVLEVWVDDYFDGRIYKGATDRKLTLEILKQKYKVIYSGKAQVWTVVPDTLGGLRKQWTRWKQNFWRMFPEVWRFAWRVHPVVAFLTYSRLILTVTAPFMLGYHLIVMALGEYEVTLLYFGGICLMAALMGLAYQADQPDKLKGFFLRLVVSLLSAVWGSQLTVRAFYLMTRRSFVWREEAKSAGIPTSLFGRLMQRLPKSAELAYILFVLVLAIIVIIVSRILEGH